MLNDLDRTILTLRYSDDLSFEDIAELLEMDSAAVRQRHARVRRKLRNEIYKDCL